MKRTDEAASTRAARPLLAPYARLLAWTIGATIAIAAAAQGVTTYSGSAVSSYGTINGWGVTDAYAGGMLHTSYVSTTLRSPKGRTSSSGWRSSINSVRADVSLGWDGTDLGTYTESSDHKFYCNVIHAFVVLGATQGSTTAPYVALALVTSDQLPMDNSAREEYNFQLGQYDLGTFRCGGYNVNCPLWVTGVQVKGQVSPNTFTGLIMFKRRIIKSITYDNTAEDPLYTKTNVMDGYESDYQDQDPQSGGSGGKVYDWDAPGTGNAGSAEVGHIRRKRSNYREWAELSNGLKVSADLNWFSRLSVYKSQSSGDLLKADISGDNVAGVGSTNTTWDLR